MLFTKRCSNRSVATGITLVAAGLTGFAGLAAIGGCGAGATKLVSSASTRSARTGTVKMTVEWPTRAQSKKMHSRLVPLASNTVLVEFYKGTPPTTLSDKTGRVAFQWVDRPAADPTTGQKPVPVTATFTGLPVGDLTVRATAYPGRTPSTPATVSDPTVVPTGTEQAGTAQYQTDIPITIAPGADQNVGVTMASTIDHIELQGPATTVAGASYSIKAVAYADPVGTVNERVVIVDNSLFTWTSSGAAKISGSTIGQTITMKTVTAGSATIAVTEKESGVYQPLNFTVGSPSYAGFASTGIPGVGQIGTANSEFYAEDGGHTFMSLSQSRPAGLSASSFSVQYGFPAGFYIDPPFQGSNINYTIPSNESPGGHTATENIPAGGGGVFRTAQLPSEYSGCFAVYGRSSAPGVFEAYFSSAAVTFFSSFTGPLNNSFWSAPTGFTVAALAVGQDGYFYALVHDASSNYRVYRVTIVTAYKNFTYTVSSVEMGYTSLNLTTDSTGATLTTPVAPSAHFDVDSAGAIYLADTAGNGYIRKFTSTGVLDSTFDATATSVPNVTSLRVGTDGFVHVVSNHTAATSFNTTGGTTGSLAQVYNVNTAAFKTLVKVDLGYTAPSPFGGTVEVYGYYYRNYPATTQSVETANVSSSGVLYCLLGGGTGLQTSDPVPAVSALAISVQGVVTGVPPVQNVSDGFLWGYTTITPH